jgi:hypothetical protein
MRIAIVFAGLTGCAVAAGETHVDRTAEAPLLVELFTSQGCSSCPPADQLLAELAHAGQLDGRPVAALAYHVDYWNDLGWVDAYSAAAWTDRQRAYARSGPKLGVYTPELVIGGEVGVVGSQSGRVAQAVAAAPKQLPITASATWSAGSVVVTATAPADADVWVAIWEDAPRTKVTRGENEGATLIAERVVRKLERVAAAGSNGTITIALPSTWTAHGAVAFAQRTDRRIVGARVLARARSLPGGE